MSDNVFNVNPYCQLMDRIKKKTPRLAFKAQTPEDAKIWRDEVRNTLRRNLKLDKVCGYNAMKSDLTIIDIFHEDTYDRLDIRIRTEVDMWVPAFLLIPRDGKGRHPLAMCFHGHGMNRYITSGCPQNESDKKNLEYFGGDYGKKLVKEGFAVFAPTARGFDERGDADCTQLHHAYSMAGLSLAGLRIWDHMRSLDALVQREDIDASAVIAAGLSMGCEQAVFLAAIDVRIKGLIASGNILEFKETAFKYRFSFCPCAYIDGLFEELDWPDIACAIAPRFFAIEHGRQDLINYPEEAILSAVNKIKKAYEIEGESGNMLFSWHDSWHKFDGDECIHFIKLKLLEEFA